MLDAISAETAKFAGHRAAWFLVWIYPIGMLLISLVVVAVHLSNAGPDLSAAQRLGLMWARESASIWSVPTWTVGRYLIAAFTAIVFAGEYGWNTWKLVVPHRARTALIAAKFALVLGLLLLALLLGAVVSVAMSGLDDAVMGLPLPIGLTPGLILKAHGTAALVAFPWLLLTVAYAGLAAILTRSTLGAAIVALVAITAEQMFGNFAPVLALYAPRLVWALYQMLPAYHLANLTGWIEQGQALRASFPLLGVVALGWTISLATLAGWIVALGGLTFAAFRRQDIN